MVSGCDSPARSMVQRKSLLVHNAPRHYSRNRLINWASNTRSPPGERSFHRRWAVGPMSQTFCVKKHRIEFVSIVRTDTCTSLADLHVQKSYLLTTGNVQ